MAGLRSLGVEEELQIVDAETFQLASQAPQMLGRLPSQSYSAEMQRSTVETNTGVWATLDELRRDLVGLRAGAAGAADDLGLAVAAAGTAPLASAADLELTAQGRYSRMQQDDRLLVDEHLVCGLQVHTDIDDPDAAVRVMPRLEHALPTLLALSASSPFWGGLDTGYASVRSTLWQRWPTAGRTARMETHADYLALLDSLIDSGVISDAKMAYFDVRPSLHVPTLELRTCDSCPLVDDVVLIAGLFRAAVDRAADEDHRGLPEPVLPSPLYRAAMWRAARSGLTDRLLDNGAEPVPLPAAEVVARLVERLRPQLEAAGDYATVTELAAAAVARGTSSDRQRARLAERGRLTDVGALLVAETAGTEVRSRAGTRWSVGYPGSAVDEAVAPSGETVAAYRPVLAGLAAIDSAEMALRAGLVRRRVVDQGLTFGVDGAQQPYPVDLLPRVIPAHEWAVLATGLTQRARALEAYLRDVYGPARIVADGVMSDAELRGCPGWRPEALTLPEGVVRSPVIGFDLVRDSIGGWRVLEDNVRVPSGVGYAIAIRRLMAEVMPEWDRAAPRHDPEAALSLIGSTLRAAGGGPDAEVALLSEGADNSGWYEHRLLAAEVGFLLAQPSEIEVGARAVTVGDRPVDVVYLRLACELVDLVDAAGRPVGRQLMEAASAGRVVVVNAPGNGVADDKAMYCRVADLVAYYLGERPLLAPVPTYRCADPVERVPVLDRLEQLVTKPVDGYGGSGVLIGPEAGPAELDRRRREILEHPEAWVAQEVVAMTTLPTVVDGRLEPRHVDLRAFVYLTGTGAGQAHLAPLALTRVAPAGSAVVNSSRGGGAKDTWILHDDDGTAGGRHVRAGR